MRSPEPPSKGGGSASRSARASGRPSLTSRAAVLAIVVGVLAVSYAYPLRAWYDQHSRRNALEQESAELRASMARQ